MTLSPSESSDDAGELTTLTDDDGKYAFSELEPGSYRIAQRQSAALIDGEDSSSSQDVTVTDDVIANLVLTDDQISKDHNFGERGLNSEFVNISWMFASAKTATKLRAALAMSEESVGNMELAASIRSGAEEVVADVNSAPVARRDSFNVEQGAVLTVSSPGVLRNDSDADADLLSAALISTTTNGDLTLEEDGAFVYSPNSAFSGTDSFSYRVGDGASFSATTTVTIAVRAPDAEFNEPFGEPSPGSFEDNDLSGTRTDLVAGAPSIERTHVEAAVDYTGYSNPPTYGPHHGFLTDANGSSITPRPTGIYETEQADEDLIHNLEHGHVWISYNPSMISSDDLERLESFVADGGIDTGVILTPRNANTSTIAVASWARLLELDEFDSNQIRTFVESNRGHSPEGYIPSGQKPDGRETFDDGFAH